MVFRGDSRGDIPTSSPTQVYRSRRHVELGEYDSYQREHR